MIGTRILLDSFVALLLVVLGPGALGEAVTLNDPRAPQKAKPLFSETTILSGFSFSDPEANQEDTTWVPVSFRVPLIHRDDWPWNADLDFFADIRAGLYIEPSYALELSVPVLLRFSVPLWTDSLSAFFEGGVGPSYMSLNTKSLGGHFNFTNQLGIGLCCPLNDDVTLEFSYRYSHLSNAGLDSPNRGMEAHTFLAGASFHGRGPRSGDSERGIGGRG